MPIEIRELIIRTEITTGEKFRRFPPQDIHLSVLKKQVLAECKRVLSEQGKKKNIKR